MTRRFLLIALNLLLAAAITPAAEAASKPNIVLIMADDFGYECVGANGGTSYKTPNLDQLAATGTRFDKCYVQPLCTPTRVQLMTGLYNVRNYTKFGELARSATTFAHALKPAGYATGIAGKWQLGKDIDSPKHFGFEESCLWQHTRRPPRYANPGLEYDGVAKDFTNGEYGPDLVNQWAVEFIEKHKDGPFLLYYPMILTHDPFQPTPGSPDWDPKAIGERVNNDPKNFAHMTTHLDTMVGNVVKKLDSLGIRDNTYVIFLGDNGTLPRITSMLNGKPYKGGKGSPTAAGMHVPLIVNRPGSVPSGKVCSDLIDSTDFFPTLCAMAGVKPPEGLDGRSFLPQLQGEPGQPREWIYCWYARNGGVKAQAEFAMGPQYKLYSTGKVFDIAADPLETKPITQPSPEAQQAVTTLQAVLDQFADARTARQRKM